MGSAALLLAHKQRSFSWALQFFGLTLIWLVAFNVYAVRYIHYPGFILLLVDGDDPREPGVCAAVRTGRQSVRRQSRDSAPTNTRNNAMNLAKVAFRADQYADQEPGEGIVQIDGRVQFNGCESTPRSSPRTDQRPLRAGG